MIHTDVNDKVTLLNDTLTQTLNIHAPLARRKISKPKAPWLSDNLRLMMHLRDKALTRYKKSKHLPHWDYYTNRLGTW